eukprot:COSAG01_NODE_2524_length_7505_cov_29.604915_2_plen_164_part_00
MSGASSSSTSECQASCSCLRLYWARRHRREASQPPGLRSAAASHGLLSGYVWCQCRARVKTGYLPGAAGRLEAEGGGPAADATSEAAGCVVSSLMHVGDVMGVAPATIPCGAGEDDGPHKLALDFWRTAEVSPQDLMRALPCCHASRSIDCFQLTCVAGKYCR